LYWISAMFGECVAHAETPRVPSNIAVSADRFMIVIVILIGRAES
jgi:hypothetical protein